MSVSLCEQTVSFLACFLTGVAMAFIYDIYGALRHVLKIKGAAQFICDCFFWIALAGVYFCVLYLTCGGRFRWFVGAGLAIGLLLYLFGASFRVRPAAEKVILCVFKITRRIFLFFAYPALRIYRFFGKVLAPALNFVNNTLKTSLFFVKNAIEKAVAFVIK